MLLVEFDRPPSLSLDASKTGESTKFPWVEAVGLIGGCEQSLKCCVLKCLYGQQGFCGFGISITSKNVF